MGEVALSLMLVAMAGLLMRSFLEVTNQDPGFEADNVWVVQVNPTGIETAEDYRLRMEVIFTDPPYAEVGMREGEARRAGRDVVVRRARFPETGRAITMGTRHGVWKLISDRESGEILGSALVGPRADDLVHLVSVMMHHGGTVQEIPELPWYHPTLSEVMLDLARDVGNTDVRDQT